MTKTHIIYIPFTGVGKNPYKGDEWFKDRIEIFKNYTLKSLLNQTNKNFRVWFSFRKEEQKHPLVHELFEYLREIKFPFSATFNGLMYTDDRNPEMCKSLPQRLEQSLFELRSQHPIHPWQHGWVYLTRIDSDDMFHKDVVQLIQDQETRYLQGDYDEQIEFKALTLQNGYVYNKDTNELAEWNPLTNPPFHTVIFPRDVFFDAEKHIEWYEGFKSHEDIARLPHKVLWRGDNRTDRLYMVFTHDPKMHISTSWEHPFKGKLITGVVKGAILMEFGI